MEREGESDETSEQEGGDGGGEEAIKEISKNKRRAECACSNKHTFICSRASCVGLFVVS